MFAALDLIPGCFRLDTAPRRCPPRRLSDGAAAAPVFVVYNSMSAECASAWQTLRPLMALAHPADENVAADDTGVALIHGSCSCQSHTTVAFQCVM